MDTPLLNALLEHIRLRPSPFHMPGHKGRMEELEAMASVGAMDVTELPDTGNLYDGGDAIEEAEKLWAAAWGMPLCQFLTGGSTQGLHAALLLRAQKGRDILVERCCHKSVYHAMGLLDLQPTYLVRRPDQPVSPQALEETLIQARMTGKRIRTVCITSPTYYGVLSDIKSLAAVAKRYGAGLLVDAAHGCHLPFLGENPFACADLVVSSAHKTLGVYGQGALLFAGPGYTARDLRWAASVVGTTSPSYPILASMDYARARALSAQGLEEMRSLGRAVALFREEYPALRGADMDPLRLTLTVDAVAADGYQIKEYLEGMGVFPEMADRDHVVFLLSAHNTPRDLDQLRRGLEAVERAWSGVFGAPLEPPRLPEPEVVFSPAQALRAPRRTLPLCRAEGQVCAQTVAPYPPGSPVIAPGERITKKGLAYLREVGYNVQEDVYVL